MFADEVIEREVAKRKGVSVADRLIYDQNGRARGEAPAEPRLGMTLPDPKTVRQEPHPPAAAVLASRRFGSGIDVMIPMRRH